MMVALACTAEDGDATGLWEDPELADESLDVNAAEREAIAARIIERRPMVHALLAEGVFGEGDDGLLAFPPASTVAPSADVESLMIEENEDRTALLYAYSRLAVGNQLFAQIPALVDPIADGVCEQLGDSVCENVDFEGRLIAAFSAVIAGDSFADSDEIDNVIRQLAEPIVDAVFYAALPAQTRVYAEYFAMKFQDMAPADCWIEVDGRWQRKPSV